MPSQQNKFDTISDQIKHDNQTSITEPTAHEQSDVSSFLEPYRRELQLHCYRLLGSLHDAEDATQDTLLRAWRHFATFKGQAALRTWLYTIATNVCLDMLKKQGTRTLPTAISRAATNPLNPREKAPPEVLWLEPFPDSWMLEATENPEARYTRQESVSLAFLTALQLLPPRQRAILILADVLDWRASEIARLLDLSVSAVNSALHRARVTLAQHYNADTTSGTRIKSLDKETHNLLARYLHAWETDDVSGLVALLKEDAIFSMPPTLSWFQGREAIQALLLVAPFGSGIQKRWRLYPTHANGQPAFALYSLDKTTDTYRAFGLQVVMPDGAAIREVVSFHGAHLVTAFGLPDQL